MNVLRVALDVPEGTLIGQHSGLIEGVKRIHPHTVNLVSQPRDCTCVAYAFELNDNLVYRAIAADFDREVFAGKKFINWIAGERLNELNEPSIDSYALYFSGTDWKHIGTVTALNRVTSQWGTYPVYEHDVFEVPASYGDRVRFFEVTPLERRLLDFLDYARHEGVSDEDIETIIAEVADQ